MSSSDDETVAPQVALTRFLGAIKNHADIDSAFRDRLLQALGVTVVYEGEDDLANVAPHIVASQKNELQFRAIYGPLSAAKLKAILKKAGLATPADMARKTADDLIDMLWVRAYNKARERGLIEN